MPWLATDGSSIFPALFAIAFLWLSLALGRRILIILGANAEISPIERGMIATGLGAGLLQFVPFALGTVGLLSTTALTIAIGAIFLAAAADLRAVGLAAINFIRGFTRPSGWTIAWLVALTPALLAAALVALSPSTDPDGLSYHLTVPKRWMHTGSLDYLPTYPYSNAPMGAQMLFAIGMAFAGDVAAKCIHYTLGLAAVAAIYLTGLRLSGRMAGAVPATLSLVGHGGLAIVMGVAYVEGIATLAISASALAWLVWYQWGNRGYLYGAALLAGLSVSFKISSAVFPVALLALTVVADVARSAYAPPNAGRGNAIVHALTGSLALIPFFAAPVLPWFARALLVTGNPFFPLFASIIPSRDLPADLASQVDRYNRYMTWGHVWRDWTIDERMWILFGVAALWVLLGAIAFFRFRSMIARGTIVVLIATGLLQLMGAGLYLRYWLPIAGVLMVPIAAAFAPFLARRIVMLAWLGITLAGSLVAVHKSQINADIVRTVAGLDRRIDFLRGNLSLYPLYELANRDLPADAGILLSAYCGAFYIDRRTFCAEMVHTAIRFTSWKEFTEDLRTHRITHVIAPTVLATGGPPPPLGGSSVSVVTRTAQYQLVRSLLTSHARTIATAADQGLYEIAPALTEAPKPTR